MKSKKKVAKKKVAKKSTVEANLQGYSERDLLTGKQTGRLEEIVLASGWIPEELRDAVSRRAEKIKGQGSEMLDALARTMGWKPPVELARWLEIQMAVDKVVDMPDEIDGWYFGFSLSPKPTFQDSPLSHIESLTTGLFPFGGEACGDSAAASLAPHPLGIVEVFYFDHETTEVAQLDSMGSIAGCILARAAWEENRVSTKRHIEQVEAARNKLPRWRRADELYRRSSWLRRVLFSLAENTKQLRTPYRFDDLLALAATRADWSREKKRLANEPMLAAYWLVAHLLAGDDDGCHEAIALAAQCPGEVAPRLAETVKAYYSTRPRKLGKILRPGSGGWQGIDLPEARIEQARLLVADRLAAARQSQREEAAAKKAPKSFEDRVAEFCLALPHTYENAPRGNRHFCVGGAFTAFAALEKYEGRPCLSIRSTVDRAPKLCRNKLIKSAPETRVRRGWVCILQDALPSWTELEKLLEDGFRVVAQRLSIKELDSR